MKAGSELVVNMENNQINLAPPPSEQDNKNSEKGNKGT
jgi:hypothetical protein